MMDTGRASSCRVGGGLSLELVWGEVIKRGVSTFTIVETLDIEVNAPLRLFPTAIEVTTYPFGLQLAEGTFGRGVVPAVALAVAYPPVTSPQTGSCALRPIRR